MKIKIVAVLTATLVAVGGLAAAPGPASALAERLDATSASATTAAPVAQSLADTSAKKKGKKRRYRVASGVTTTSPLESNRGAITQKILRVINHTRSGSKIRAVSWNFSSDQYAGALTAAHRRGVTVQIYMARTLATAQGPSGSYNVMLRNLNDKDNRKRKTNEQSWIRTCDHSCRGKGGAMHAKYYVFSQSGKTEKIVMNTSANLTQSASVVQWNDLFTVTKRPVTFNAYVKVFNQMAADTKQKYFKFRDDEIYGWFYPRVGRTHLVMKMLNNVKCGRAKDAGINGKTAIRVGQDVFNNKVGSEILRKLISLNNNGCNVKVVYSQAVGYSKGLINQLPSNHLVQDLDGDGAYDRYLHAKIMTISGNYNGNRSERIAFNGSANWSGTAILSDEQGMIIDDDKVERDYAKYINKMFKTQLQSVPLNPAYRGRVIDPYRNMES